MWFSSILDVLHVTYTKSVLFMGAAVLAQRARAVAETSRASPSPLLPRFSGSPGVVPHERKLKQPIDVSPSRRGASAASQRSCGSHLRLAVTFPNHRRGLHEAYPLRYNRRSGSLVCGMSEDPLDQGLE